MRLFPSLKSTHWVIWSSPLLLLVLVFTLTTSSSSAPRRHESSRATTTTYAVSTTTAPKTTTTIPPTSTTTTTIRRVRATKPVVVVSTKSAATTARHATSSSSSTASSVKPVASAPAESASSGVLSGQLSPSFAVADVPLEGPGTWTVATSAPATLTLRCANQSIGVHASFVIGANERCQLTITPAASATSLTWQLTPST